MIDRSIKHALSGIFLIWFLKTSGITHAGPSITMNDQIIRPDFEHILELFRKNKLNLESISSLKEISFVSDDDLSKMVSDSNRAGEILALTVFETGYSSYESRIYLAKSIKGDRIKRLLFLTHELLHVLGYDHHSSPCHWLEKRCGLLGHHPPNNNLSMSEANLLINRSLSKLYLDKMPRIPTQKIQRFK